MNRVAASIEDIHPIASPLPLDESRIHFRQTLSSSLTNSLIGRWWNGIAKAIGWLTRRKKVIPFELAVVFFNIFTLVVSISLSLLLGETAITRPDYFLPLVVWVIFTVLYILVMHAQLTHAVQILSTTIAENIPSTNDLVNLQNLIQKGMRLFWQFAFSLLFAIISGVWIPYVLSIYSGAEFLIGARVLYVFNYFQVGMYIYFLLVVISVLLGLSRFELDIYANDPSNSPVIRRIYQVSSTLTLCAAALGAIHYFLISVRRVDISAPYMLATLIVLGWLPPIILFITIHLSLARIMTEAKGRKLAQIQEIIRQTERGSDLATKEPLESIQRLMNYHDRIRATPNSMVNLNSLSNLLGSLLMPLIATILGNITTILALFRPPPPP